MDFRRLSRALPSPAMDNTSRPLNFTELSPNILDALVPGYSVASQYALAAWDVDISVFVVAALALLATVKAGTYLATQAERAFRFLFVSSVHINDGDDLFDMVMAWLDARADEAGGGHRHRNVRARTQRGSQWDDDAAGAGAGAGNGSVDAADALADNGLFDYVKWAARTPPRYEPYYGRHLVWHGGRLFVFRRAQRQGQGQALALRVMLNDRGGGGDEDVLQIDCVGRSPAPTKALLRTIKAWALARRRGSTTIRHPLPKDQGRHRGLWTRTSSRPSRPMDTVILDAAQKAAVVADMNEFLHPASPRWYAMRGIPYRRGYLFHGPPGTGKTSLSFALAGIFGLEIYAISLQEPTLTESDLMQLFNALPKRCVVLLEDIDTAGLLRDGKSDQKGVREGGAKKRKGEDGGKGKSGSKDGEGAKSKEKNEADYTLKDLARELKAIGPSRPGRGGGGRGGNDDRNIGHPNRPPGTGVSLSGLLNAIDGVATHEGRVLIMTTNHPEKLDSALVRPGRIDLRIEFKLAVNDQIRELFVRMYTASDELARLDEKTVGKLANGSAVGGRSRVVNGSASERNGEKHENGGAKSMNKTEARKSDEAREGEGTEARELGSLTRRDLDSLAAEFANQVPDATYTPAEIQNHLMKYKKHPRTAVERVREWMEEVQEEKNKKRREVDEADDGGDAEDYEDGDDDGD